MEQTAETSQRAYARFAGLMYCLVLSPPFANSLYTYIQVLGVLAEVSLMLWLLVMGVNAERWKELESQSLGTRTDASDSKESIEKKSIEELK